MTHWTRRVAKKKQQLSAMFAPLVGRPAIVLAGLILVAVLPGLVQLEWHRPDSQDPDFSTFSRATTAQPLSDATDKARWQDPPGPTSSSSPGSVDIEWDSYTRPQIADDEQEPVDFDCMIEPWESVSVRSPVIGRIDAIHVERADVVKAGDLLLELDSNLSRADLEMARQRAGMTASIRSYEARNSLRSKRSEHAAELFSRDAIALDARDEIMMEKAVSEFELEDARDQHALARLQLEREQARFEQRRIRSPFDGVVADRLMSVGEVVDEETVLELAQIDPLRVEVVLPAIEFGSLRTGMKAAVVPEIPGDEIIVATVRVVDRIIDSASGTFGAVLELPNPAHEIPGGLRCRVRFLDAAAESEELARAEPSDP